MDNLLAATVKHAPITTTSDCAAVENVPTVAGLQYSIRSPVCTDACIGSVNVRVAVGMFYVVKVTTMLAAALVFIPSLTVYVIVSAVPVVGAKYSRYDPSSLIVADEDLPPTAAIVKTLV